MALPRILAGCASLAVALLLGQMAAAQDSRPPRSVRDIKALIDAQPKAARADIAVADAEPPAGASAADLAKFHRARALAAYAVGRDAQAAADHHLALAKAREARLDIYLYLISASAAERDLGSYLKSVELSEEAVKLQLARNYSPILSYKNVVLGLVQVGDLAQAEVKLKENEQALRKVESNFDQRRQVPGARATTFDVRGRYLVATGRLIEAESAIRASISELEKAIATHDPSKDIPIVLMHEGVEIRTALLAEILTKQGRMLEAEIEARRAVDKMLRRGANGGAQGAALLGTFADVLMEQGRFIEAEAIAREAEAALVAVVGEGATAGALARTRMRVAQALALRGKPRRAGEAMTPVLAMQGGDAIKLLAVGDFDPILLGAMARAKQGPAAEALSRALLDRRVKAVGQNSYAAAEVRGFLAVVLSMQGRKDEALTEFRQVIPVLLEQGVRSEDQIANGIRLQAILESYLTLLFELKDSPALKGIDLAAETFQLAEAVRGRLVQRSIAASAARAMAGDPALAEHMRREQDLGQRVAAFQQTLKETTLLPTSQQLPEAQAALRAEIEKLVAERAALTKEIARRFPDYANLINPKPVTLATARGLLKQGETLVTFLAGVEQSYVWAIPARGDALVAVVKVSADQATEMAAVLRRALDPQAAGAGEGIPAFDLGLAHRLYAEFLAPVQPALDQAKSLLVVPHGALGQVPLSLLVMSKPPAPKVAALTFEEYRSVAWLVRKMAVTQLPSVSTLVSLRALPPGRVGRLPLVAFGDPVFASDQAGGPQAASIIQVRGQSLAMRATPRTGELDSADLSKLPRLPETADEITAIANALGADPARDLFLGPRASEENVLAMDLAKWRIVLFATHGLVPGDLDGLTQPALALSSPAVVGGTGNGLLTLDKVLKLKLDADWVVLSACNTASASGAEGAGAEGLSGLARAFFYAGARTLLVSNWPVETNSATAITTGLFKRLAADPTMSRAEALRQSVLTVLDRGVQMDANGKPSYAFAHPIFWAPFSVVGDGWSTDAAN